MVLYPDIQKKAQAEIDAVVGRGRLPTFEDRPHLPYLHAVIYGLMRWYPAMPEGNHVVSYHSKPVQYKAGMAHFDK
ncbi:cytochrome P450 [Phlebopus sp. FC_14]|nr:cytochrome P450 [Phlebopus sp. FC_14]